jgi:hypothetical protein
MAENQQPGMISRFFKGALSGAFSGAMMMGLVALIATAGIFPGFQMMQLGGMAAMVTCTALFSGIMSVVRGGGESKARPSVTAEETLTPVISQSVGRAPSVNMDVAEDMAPARADGKRWTETAGRGRGTQTQIDAILENGAMSDRDRASAILAARELNSASEAAR